MAKTELQYRMARRDRHNQTVIKDNTGSKRPIYILVVILLLIIVLSSFINILKNSLFFAHKDRLNIIVYGEHTAYYSIGLKTTGDYVIPFYPDLKLQVPGGYGGYRVGALGKLISLENKPEILQRTFSLATYSFTDYIFYNDDDEVFFGDNKDFSVPSIMAIFTQKSNAGFLDRLYITLLFLNKNGSDFTLIPIHAENNATGDSVFAADQFEKKYTGYFFQKTYRNEGKSVQIIYTNKYINAVRVGKILEGNGIRVGDISHNESAGKECVIVEDSRTISLSANVLLNVFHCQWKRGKTDIYDILFQLGDREKDWEVQE
jgi:hypothetical protein